LNGSNGKMMFMSMRIVTSSKVSTLQASPGADKTETINRGKLLDDPAAGLFGPAARPAEMDRQIRAQNQGSGQGQAQGAGEKQS
jgi:hypothetical protein